MPAHNIGQMPIKATLYKDGKPVVTPDGHQVDRLYLPALNTKKSAEQRTPKEHAQYEEAIKMREAAVAAQHQGKRLRVDFNFKTRGNIKTAPNVGNKFAKNNPMDIFPTAVTSNWVYGHDMQFLDRSSGEAILHLPLAGFSTATSGAIYIATKGANGEMLPARLHVDNLNSSEAALIYEVMKSLVKADVHAAPISEDLKTRIKNSKNERITGLYKYMDLGNTPVTYGELLNELVFSGREVTMGKKESQLWIARNAGIRSLVIANNSFISI